MELAICQLVDHSPASIVLGMARFISNYLSFANSTNQKNKKTIVFQTLYLLQHK
jgi:hypothetical protein